VLPMNPPRLELDSALRFIFAEHGVSVKKSGFHDHRLGMHRKKAEAKNTTPRE